MSIAIDLGGTNVRVATVLSDGQFGQILSEPCLATGSENEVLEQLYRLIDDLFGPEVDGIGIGVPSVVDTTRGIVYNVVGIPSWKEVHLKDLLEARYHVPAAVDNDCNCFAKGVANSKYGIGYSDLVCMTLGTGVGAGLIVNGQLYTGKNSCAGEIGCIKYKDKDYESYCSSQFFLNLGTTAKEEAEKAGAGDPEALKLWEEFGTNVGDLINMVTFAYDPQVIMIGGGISSAFGLFEAPMRARMAEFPYSNVAANLRVFSDPSGDFMLVGAVM